MSAQALRSLRAAITSRTFEPAYYLYGDDDFRKDAAIRELTAAAVDASTRDFNYDMLRGAELTPEQLESALNTPPMMATRRAIVIRDVPSLKRDARQVLDRYLEHPARDVVLVLVAPAGARPDATLDRLTVGANFAPLTANDLTDWITQYTRVALGASITPEANRLLQEVVGSDAAQLAAELDKLASYTQGRAIDDSAVSDVVGVRNGETLGDFLDRIAERDAPAALAMVEHILGLPKSGLVPVIMALAVQTMALGWARAARDRGLPPQRLESEFFTLLKETGAFPMRPWGEAAKCWARNHPRWDARSVEHGLEVLLAADHAAKDTRISSEEQLLASIVCSLCTPMRRAAA
jgi:DNA polymerase III subunit delta